MIVTRRGLFRAAPSAAMSITSVFCLTSSPDHALGQLSGNSPTIEQIKQLENKVSPTTKKALQLNFGRFAGHDRLDRLDESSASSLAVTLAIYFGNLKEVGWNTAVDQYIKANPDKVLNWSMSNSQAQSIVNEASALGISNMTADAIVANSFLTSEEKSSLVADIQSKGSAEYFEQAAYQLLGQVPANSLINFHPRMFAALKDTPSCHLLAGLTLIATLTGNEVAALVGAYGVATYCA